MSPSSWTPFLPPSTPYPSRMSQSTGFGCPASYINLALFICFAYGNVYVLMLFSQIISPSPSPTEAKSLCLCPYLLCCPACRIIGTIFLPTGSQGAGWDWVDQRQKQTSCSIIFSWESEEGHQGSQVILSGVDGLQPKCKSWLEVKWRDKCG